MLTQRGRAYGQNHQLEGDIHIKILAISDQPEMGYFSIYRG
jgi:hypothetical protein